MRKKYQIKKSISEINVTPFVDVMLVLLIIFMVTAPLLTAGIKVNLPESSSILKNEKNDPVTVTMNSDGEIFIQKKFSPDGLIKKLSALKAQNKDLKIYIKGDKNLNYGKIIGIYVAFINKSGFKKVALVTKLK